MTCMFTQPDSIQSDDMTLAIDVAGYLTHEDAAAAIANYRESITRRLRDEYEADLAECFDGGVSELVFWAFRYFLGRRTVHVSVFARGLVKAWPHLNHWDRDTIAKELEDAFRIDEGVTGTGYLGDPCDRAAWQLVRDAYSKTKQQPSVEAKT
jgi:hypothetical protein